MAEGALLVALSIALSILGSACRLDVSVGAWACPAPDASQLGAIGVPWSTSFETGFCDYSRAGGFCYGAPDATHRIVETPAHSGRRAAAFSVTADPAKDGAQARCVLQGALPVVATYGAWFYLPAPATTTDNWNLLHFQGGAPDAWHGLWDVSIDTAADGSLFLYVFDVLGGASRVPQAAPPIPIGRWFHVELHLARAKDATGEVALYQDGVRILELSGIVTDDSDLGQWYTGNLAKGLTPVDSTIYVDDVTMSPAP